MQVEQFGLWANRRPVKGRFRSNRTGVMPIAAALEPIGFCLSDR
jgi:hypothetical protein